VAEHGAFEEIACPSEAADEGLVASDSVPQPPSLDELREQLGPTRHLQEMPAHYLVAKYARVMEGGTHMSVFSYIQPEKRQVPEDDLIPIGHHE
jgi:hypothetical protein